MESNGSIWRKDVSIPEFPALRGNWQTEVLVIGGGITGLLCAWYLQNAGLAVTVAEAKTPMSGESGGTTAKITSQHGRIYGPLRALWGQETARLYYLANQAAVEEYRRLGREFDCDFSDQDAFLFSRRSAGPLKAELTVLRDIGAEAALETHLDLPFPVRAALKFPRQAQMHPMKLAAALAGRLTVFAGTPVTALEGKKARTPWGTIRADRIIVATHFPFLRFRGGYALKLYQQRSCVLALKNAPEIPGMYLEAEENGISLRRQGELLLLGGGGHRTGQPGGWETLEQTAAAWFPQGEIVGRWAAQDCMPPDHLPYIGGYGPQGRYVATGFQKWGMTTAMVSALLLRDAILQRPNPWAAIFSPRRRTYWPAIGRNMRSAGKNLLTFSRPRCSHLGCALRWNPREHSWDCPCHGSRFSESGETICGPAAMEKKKTGI